jgi:hypothetical protein
MYFGKYDYIMENKVVIIIDGTIGIGHERVHLNKANVFLFGSKKN